MPKPTEFKPNNYKVNSVLFDNTEFSIVLGTWKGNKNILAMRWNGDNEDDKGYPKTFGHPMWFIIHNDLKQPIIQALMQNDKNIIDKLLDKSILENKS
jgi:hypothetical protein